MCPLNFSKTHFQFNMKKIILIITILASGLFFSQEKSNKLGFFSSIDANIGFDLGDIIRTNKAQTQYEIDQLPPGKYHYGFSAMVGYHPLNWFSLSGGLRYSYIDPNFHLIYFKVQPQVFVGDLKDEDYTYFFANFGRKINQTAAKEAGFVGIGFGMIEPFGKRFGHQFQVNLDDQIIDGSGTIFIGISYGIILFSNKDL